MPTRPRSRKPTLQKRESSCWKRWRLHGRCVGLCTLSTKLRSRCTVARCRAFLRRSQSRGIYGQFVIMDARRRVEKLSCLRCPDSDVCLRKVPLVFRGNQLLRVCRFSIVEALQCSHISQTVALAPQSKRHPRSHKGGCEPATDAKLIQCIHCIHWRSLSNTTTGWSLRSGSCRSEIAHYNLDKSLHADQVLAVHLGNNL